MLEAFSENKATIQPEIEIEEEQEIEQEKIEGEEEEMDPAVIGMD